MLTNRDRMFQSPQSIRSGNRGRNAAKARNSLLSNTPFRMSHLTRAERLMLLFLLAVVAGVSVWKYYRFFTIQNHFPAPLESPENSEKP